MMSAEDVLKAIDTGVVCLEGFGPPARFLRDARTAVAAMAEREAALVDRITLLEERDMMLTKQIVVYAATRDALRAEVEALKISLATSQDAYKLSGTFVEAMANEMRDAGCEVDGTKVRNLRAEALVKEVEALRGALVRILPYVQHSDCCGDMDVYNNAAFPSCGCGLDAAVDFANEAIDAARAEARDG